MIDVQKQKEQQQELHTKLWAMANNLRGTMEPYQFKDYILGLLFYRFLSEKTQKFVKEMFENDGLSYNEAWEDKEIQTELREVMIEEIGYVIEPKYLFTTLISKIEDNTFDVEYLKAAIDNLMESTIGKPSQSAFEELFEDIKLEDNKLGRTTTERTLLISKVLSNIGEIKFSNDEIVFDVLGSAYEYLISMFAQTAGKKAGEFFSPDCFTSVLANLSVAAKFSIKPNPKDKDKYDVLAISDPTCGSGGLLLKLNKLVNVRKIYGTELTSTTYNLARMNMLLHGINYNDFDIKNSDTLERPPHLGIKFDIQVSNPPYSVNWSADKKFLQDPRFAPYSKLAPSSKGDFAFVQHVVHSMKEDGVATILLPHGILFRGAAEETIRTYLIEQLNVVDAIIGLPAGCFYGTDIPVVCLVLKKGRENKDIFFIDASQEFEKGKNQNTLLPEHINKIVDTYLAREDVEKYAHKATFEEIKENEFNLNIPRFVDTFEEEEEIDLQEVKTQISTTKTEIAKIEQELDVYFKELGI